MIKVRMLTTDEIVEVTPNIAHELIDTRKAELYTGRRKITEIPVGQREPTSLYPNRQMRASFKGKEVIKTE